MDFKVRAIVRKVCRLNYCVVFRVQFCLVEGESRLKVIGYFLSLVGWGK